MSMEVISKYVDVESGEPVGYLYQNGVYCVAVSKKFATENKLADSEILEYLELPCISIVSSGGSIYDVSNATYVCNGDIWHNTAYEDFSHDIEFYYHCSHSEICIGDYVFNKLDCIELDNMTAYERCRTGVEL